MIRGKFLTSLDDTADVFAIREKVFVNEQGYAAENERDRFDRMAVYALVFDETGVPGGTGRLYIDGEDHFHIGRVCVLRECRGMGMGDLVMRMLLYRAQEMHAPSVYLSSQLPAVAFYARYGFRAIGDAYPEEGVPHQQMRALEDEINLEGTCGGHPACIGSDGCQGDCARCQKN